MDRLNRRITLLTTGCFVIFLIVSAFLFMPRGEALYDKQRCSACHRLRGQGGISGPDLTDVTKRRGTFWIMRQIKNPQSHNPESRMPVFDHLNYLEIWAIISYLKTT